MPRTTLIFPLILVCVFWGCGSDEPVSATPPVTAKLCESDAACDNGLFCDGVETCASGVCLLASAIVCDDGVACTTDSCSNELAACVFVARDADADGHADVSCVDGDGAALGDDCDDADANRYPGNTEVCDVSGHDEDCDGDTFGRLDVDGDGYFSASCCNGTTCGDDCDDLVATVRPFGTEVCDDRDNDCDGTTDEGVTQNLYADLDGDGFGDEASVVAACAGAQGVSNLPGDCDDENPARHPAQLEVCDLQDNDCDPNIDEDPQVVAWYPDVDQDGYGTPLGPVTMSCAPPPNHSLRDTDCNDDDPAISPVAAERCDGIDNNCNGLADFRLGENDFEDDDGDGLVDLACETGTDCDDENENAGPGLAELCDGLDNDCDSAIDETAVQRLWYVDLDQDGFGSAQSGVALSCQRPSSLFSAGGGDCDDQDADRSPGAPEICDTSDNDCDSNVDEATDFSQDGNCGECGKICGGPDVLTGTCSAAGTCVCEAGFGDCNGDAGDEDGDGCETDLTSTDNHCGTCGKFCQLPGALLAICQSSTCVAAACLADYDSCDDDLGNGCETQVTTPTQCGSCENDCSATQSNVTTSLCTGGACDYGACVADFGDCNEEKDDGCEIATGTDPLHCGGCENVCDSSPRANGNCALDTGPINPGGYCGCEAGFEECDRDPETICETAYWLPTACGAAGCGSLPSCVVEDQNGAALCNVSGNTGTCAVECNPNAANCTPGDSNALTCETALGTVANCNGCGQNCDVANQNGIPLCLATGIGAYECRTFCDFGFADCDGASPDCETDVRTDDENCGACGNDCTASGEVCEFGSCVTGSGGTGGGGGGELLTSQVVVGEEFTCALTLTGLVYCWGENAEGQLGTAVGAPATHTPQLVDVPSAASAIFAGRAHACAILPGLEELYCWGRNTQGQVGVDTGGAPVFLPAAVGGFTPRDDPDSVALGSGHSCAVQMESGDVYCWGQNDSGQRGDGSLSTGAAPYVPSPVPLQLGPASAVRAGADFTCMQEQIAGDLRCWGENPRGQLGNQALLPGTSQPNPSTPVISGTAELVWATGEDHGCVHEAAPRPACWGANTDLQLGNALSADSSSLVQTGYASPPAAGVVALSGHRAHTCVLTEDQAVYCWGTNVLGQLGAMLPPLNYDEPKQVVFPPLNDTMSSIARGFSSSHSCAVGVDNVIWCWGSNGKGQLNRPPSAVGSSSFPLEGP